MHDRVLVLHVPTKWTYGCKNTPNIKDLNSSACGIVYTDVQRFSGTDVLRCV